MSDNDRDAIPRIVHFVWLQGAEHLQMHRPSYWENIQRAKSIFGQPWEIKLWDCAAIEALIRLAIVPASMARTPSLARSFLRSGTSAPMPPICMPIDPRFAKPHKANVAIVNDRGARVAFSVPSAM